MSHPALLLRAAPAVLLMALTLSLPARAIDPADGAGGKSIYRVLVRDGDEVHRLLEGGWDLVEARGPDYLLIVGDPADVEALRRQGFTVTLEETGAGRAAPFTFYGGYRTVFEHYQYLDAVAAAYPHLAQVIDYGDSWRKTTNQPNGHDLKAICITRLRPGDCALNPNTDKPRLLMIAAIHARELSTSEMAWRWIDYLVAGYNIDPDVTWLLDYHELWVIPVANPDGRLIVETSNIWQRKNTNTTHCGWGTFGVDLNRNAGFAWGGSGSSGFPCDETYRGPAPASEPEEYHLEALMQQLFHDQRGPLITDTAPLTTSGVMLTLHSYSDLILLPWGWTQCTAGSICQPDRRAPNDTGLRALGFRMSYFNGYSTGQAAELLYWASGTTDDWAYGTLGIAAYTFEIGPQSGACGAFHPAYSCQDSLFWPQNRLAFVYAAKVARQPYALAHGPSALSLTLGVSGTLLTIGATIDDATLGTAGFGRPVIQSISAAEMYLDLPPWAGGVPIPMTAQDGSFNSTSERVVGVLDAGSVGRHLVFVRGRDAEGNWGPPTAMWLTQQAMPIVRHQE
ncbi:MAG: M14 family zinc carboxypeptidase [Anaerolineae bacterium]|nr:M14 family zinc carboxypeptidase [Thermoflexales bacterium]MDW8407471.1 M14 family zinc carboxypeptidase [Anaerolineae bacterium]